MQDKLIYNSNWGYYTLIFTKLFIEPNMNVWDLRGSTHVHVHDDLERSFDFEGIDTMACPPCSQWILWIPWRGNGLDAEGTIESYTCDAPHL